MTQRHVRTAMHALLMPHLSSQTRAVHCRSLSALIESSSLHTDRAGKAHQGIDGVTATKCVREPRTAPARPVRRAVVGEAI